MKVLESTIEISIRFSETDAMGVVWHGNYLKFFEDAREHFGKEFGMEYLDMYKKGYFTPIVKSQINHKASIYYGQNARITATLEKHPASKIIFTYEVINLDTGKVAAIGSTMQVFLDRETDLLELIKPQFYSDWEDKQTWKEL